MNDTDASVTPEGQISAQAEPLAYGATPWNNAENVHPTGELYTKPVSLEQELSVSGG